MFLSTLSLLSPDLGLWLNFSSVTKTKHEMYCPAKYHLSWYCQTWKSIKALLQGVTKKAWTVEGRKARKICFPLPCAFHFRQTKSVTKTLLHWDANCATRPACNYWDDEILHILLSCANNRAEFPKLRSTCSATGAPSCSVPALLSHLTATKATGKWIDSRNNQRGLQRRTLFSVSFSFEPRCLCLFGKFQCSLLNVLVDLGTKFAGEATSF